LIDNVKQTIVMIDLYPTLFR